MILGDAHCLATHGSQSNVLQVFTVSKLYRYTNFAQRFFCLFQGLSVATNDNCWVDALVQQLFRAFQQLSSQHYRGRGSVANHVVLGLRYLHHHLGSGMLHVNFVKDGRAVVSYRNVAEAVDEHLIHAPWSQSCLDGFSDDTSRHDIVSLSISATPACGPLFKDENGLSSLRG